MDNETDLGASNQASGGDSGSHAAAIEELRSEIIDLRERIREASSRPAGGGSSEAVLLRLSELERKLGQDNSDPLLDEIAQRLTMIEARGSGGVSGGGARVDELAREIGDLKDRVNHAASDPRTDDIVLRMASLESAVKKAAQGGGSEELRYKLASLEEDVRKRQTFDLAELRKEIEKIRSEVESSPAAGGDGETAGRLDAIADRLSALEGKIGAETRDSRVDELANRVSGLESGNGVKSDLDALRDRLASLEGAGESGADSARLDAISARVDRLQSDATARGDIDALRRRLDSLESAAGESGRGVEEIASLTERLGGVEQKLTELSQPKPPEESEGLAAVQQRLKELASEGGELELLAARIDEIEAGASTSELKQQLKELDHRLSSLQDVANPRLNELEESIKDLESRVRDGESTSRLEDADARLKDVEEKLKALDEIREVERRLTVLEMSEKPDHRVEIEDLQKRLGTVENAPKPAEPDNAAIDGLTSRVDGLERKLSSNVDSGDLKARIDAMAERLFRMEQRPGANTELVQIKGRLDELGQQLASLPAQQPAGDLAAELNTRLEPVLSRLNSLEQSSGASADVNELKSEIEGLKSRLAQIADQNQPASDQTAELNARLEPILARLSSLEQSPGGSADVGAFKGELQDLKSRLAQIADVESGDMTAHKARLDELVARMGHLEEETAAGRSGDDLRTQVNNLGAKLDDLLSKPMTAGGIGAADPRVTELVGRVTALEHTIDGVSIGDAAPGVAGGGAANDRIEALERAIETSKENAGVDREARAKFADLEERIAEMEQANILRQQEESRRAEMGDPLASFQSDKDRWDAAAARSAEEAAELRQQLSELQKKVADQKAELPTEALEAFAVTVSAGLNKNDLRRIQTQMYMVFFAVFLLFMLTAMLFMTMPTGGAA